MAPPELPAEAPVADVAHPMHVGLRPALRIKLDGAGLDGVDGLGDLRIPEEPLLAQVRLNGHVGAFTVAHVVRVLLDLDEQAGFLELFDDGFPAFEPVQAFVIFPGFRGHRAVGRNDNGQGELVPQGHFVVGEVVRGRDLDAAGAELRINGGIRNHRDFLVAEREHQFLADEMPVTRVVRVHRHGFVAEHGFRARGGDHDIGTIADMPEMPLRFGHDDFFVGERGATGGIPIDHPFAPVDETFFVKVNEGAEDGLRVSFVHRETFAGPIAGTAEFLELLDDDAAVFVFPLPDFFQELVAAEVVAMFDDALFAERFLDDSLRGNAGMVGARQPEHFIALHPFAAGKDVLQGVVEHVAHREDAGHIGRRDDDGVGGLRRGRVCGKATFA